jgi:protein gp37
MSDSKIEWAPTVWNPITGCSKSCPNCYAKSFANRMKNNPNPKVREKYRNGFLPTFHPEVINEPSKWRKPKRVFVGSMGDLFDPAFTIAQFFAVMRVMNTHREHTFMLLTQQADTMLNYIETWLSANDLKKLPQNIWCGVTVTNQADADDRIPVLINVPAHVRFVSIEPLTGPINLTTTHLLRRNFLLDFISPRFYNYISNIQWVICGGMTGNKATPMHPHWVEDIRRQCVLFDKPFFFKGWGAYYTSWINMSNGVPQFKYFNRFLEWQQKMWVKPGDKLVSIDGTIPKCGGDMKTCKYPVAILSKAKKGIHNRLLNGMEWNQIP